MWLTHSHSCHGISRWRVGHHVSWLIQLSKITRGLDHTGEEQDDQAASCSPLRLVMLGGGEDGKHILSCLRIKADVMAYVMGYEGRKLCT